MKVIPNLVSKGKGKDEIIIFLVHKTQRSKYLTSIHLIIKISFLLEVACLLRIIKNMKPQKHSKVNKSLSELKSKVELIDKQNQELSEEVKLLKRKQWSNTLLRILFQILSSSYLPEGVEKEIESLIKYIEDLLDDLFGQK